MLFLCHARRRRRRCYKKNTKQNSGAGRNESSLSVEEGLPNKAYLSTVMDENLTILLPRWHEKTTAGNRLLLACPLRPCTFDCDVNSSRFYLDMSLERIGLGSFGSSRPARNMNRRLKRVEYDK